MLLPYGCDSVNVRWTVCELLLNRLVFEVWLVSGVLYGTNLANLAVKGKGREGATTAAERTRHRQIAIPNGTRRGVA